MRLKKTEYYLEIAKAISLRSTCLRAHAGAIIVKDDAIVSTGYSGSPRGEENCCDRGRCWRADAVPGTQYELCPSVHAEQNAIINAARSGQSVLGGKMYIYFERLDNEEYRHGKPCTFCRRMLINAGIDWVVDREIVLGEVKTTIAQVR